MHNEMLNIPSYSVALFEIKELNISAVLEIKSYENLAIQ
jgi:hypothetical protein